MKLCIVGSGYVGLVAAACFANSGNRVRSVDIDHAKIDGLRRNELPIYEPGLQEIVARNQADGRLSFSTDVAEAIRESDVIFIAVGTPQDEDGSADLRHVCSVAETVADNLDRFKVIVNKSTVPVGTADLVTNLVAARTTGDFTVVSNPEFLKEGTAVQDFKYPDRVIVGTDDPRARDIMGRLYEPFSRTRNRVMFMDVRSAEMSKYAANAMLATRISFMNEIAGLCEKVGADVEMVRRGIGSDPRIGSKFLFPGVGFGGSCFPKDVRALVETARQYDQPLDILRAVWDANERQKNHLVDLVCQHFGQDLADITLAVWGLAFKPETDDMREAPSLTIIDGLLQRGATVRVTDPVAMDNARRLLGDRVTYIEDDYETLQGADALLVVTEWPEFRTPDFERMRNALRRPVVFDGRNLYEPDRMQKHGFVHFSIGRPAPEAG
ncbi:MAG: UDP-glucose/GDP-mannose dehydrogenase family protein [Deltaproteobacteria bacterium]|nr:MAG: UDP-glucose/GDP-mannose dehydrogenase family protein [Deltaproteobacteria bacterium]